MPYTNEYLRFLKTFNKHQVDYLIIGAYATMIYTNVISKEDLIKLKKHFDRPQDKMDLSSLEEEK